MYVQGFLMRLSGPSEFSYQMETRGKSRKIHKVIKIEKETQKHSIQKRLNHEGK